MQTPTGISNSPGTSCFAPLATPARRLDAPAARDACDAEGRWAPIRTAGTLGRKDFCNRPAKRTAQAARLARGDPPACSPGPLRDPFGRQYGPRRRADSSVRRRLPMAGGRREPCGGDHRPCPFVRRNPPMGVAGPGSPRRPATGSHLLADKPYGGCVIYALRRRSAGHGSQPPPFARCYHGARPGRCGLLLRRPVARPVLHLRHARIHGPHLKPRRQAER